MLLFFVAQFTWFSVLSALILSFLVPSLGLIVKPHLDFLLMLLMFLSCLDTDFFHLINDLRSDIKKPLTIVTIAYLVSPTLTFFLFRRFLSPELFLGLILATSTAAGRSIVFLSRLYGGQPAKALVVSTVSGLVSPIVIPALVWIFSHTTIELDAAEMSLKIVFLIIVPFIAAVLVNHTGRGRFIKPHTENLSTVFLFVIIIGIITPIRSTILDNLPEMITLSLMVTFLVIINFFLGYRLGTTTSEKITYGISASYKNYTLTNLLALTFFGPVVALPSIAYTLVNNLLLIPLQLFTNDHK